MRLDLLLETDSEGNVPTFSIASAPFEDQIPGLLEIAEPLVAREFRRENVRILAELRRYVEAQPNRDDLKTSGTPEAP
jgi:hypothetical protein